MAILQGGRIPQKLIPIRKDKNQPNAVPTNADLTRFLERRRAQELGFELPMNTEEAAAYVGYHPKTVERMARMGEIPAHPVSGVRRKTWKFFPSELDAWLRSKVNSRRYPCSPDGKDSID
jgi:excisionase family DNA binding protein